MAKRDKDRLSPLARLKAETKHSVLAVACLALAVFFLLAAFSLAGRAGDFTYQLLASLFGTGYYLFPILVGMLGVGLIRQANIQFFWGRVVSGVIFFFGTLALLNIVFGNSLAGGAVGQVIARPLVGLFDNYISVVFLLAIDVITLLLIFDTALPWHWLNWLRGLWRRPTFLRRSASTALTNLPPAPMITEESGRAEAEAEEDSAEPPALVRRVTSEPEETVAELPTLGRFAGRPFEPPPLNLLEKDSGKSAGGDIKASSNIIKRTLQNFGMVVEMDEVSIGPSITRYALKPAEGVKLSRIVGLQNDLALALAAHPLRIEAPIPGKSLVGIEIPNTTKTIVGLHSMIASREFVSSPHPLLTALGRGISGQIHTANIAKSPHMLIAGATGSGKSVVIHAIITSLLYRNSPDQLRFIMIDPKRVELTLYKKIPHLLTPVVTQAKKAILVLKWAIGEMERRYELLENYSVRDLQSYHQTVYGEDGEAPNLPYIVIVIDELADIMSSFPRELEAAIVRLAQMSRAVGIHLVLSTQRPSVDVITGLIKANIPTRIALQVASQIDSRTILDMPGAEKLLGAGDLLYLSGEMSKPVRLQSAFISEAEVKRVVEHIAKQYEGLGGGDDLTLAELAGEGNGDSLETTMAKLEAAEDDDPLYEEAKSLILGEGKASATYIQRRLKVGYARAARLLDLLEQKGVIGPGEGAKPREIYSSSGAGKML